MAQQNQNNQNLNKDKDKDQGQAGFNEQQSGGKQAQPKQDNQNIGEETKR